MDGVAQQSSASFLSDELWRNGHVLIKAAAADLDEYRTAISNAVYRCSIAAPPLEDRSTYDKAFLQVTNLWQKDGLVQRFVFEKKFAQIAADLLGVEKVRLYHDQALFKEPAGGHTPWHQDRYYWPLDTDKMITMWMPLTDIDEDMGIITFASGSHTRGPIVNVEISDESEEFYKSYVSKNKFPIEKASSMKAGDATFHLGWTIHSAGPNRSTKTREVMTIIYFADGARVTKPNSKHQRADLDAWLGRKQPGEIADSEMNPVMN
jgi:ectoine hydroxylase-related dioxygenase (phytanoyl-CoA dioxygenase family)